LIGGIELIYQTLMAKQGKYKDSRFEDSLALIPQIIDWAEKQNVERLRRFFITNADIPLYVVSSGGASAHLHYAALLYEANHGMAKALTPLGLASVSDKTLKNSKILVFSKSGKGVDTKYIVKRAIGVNPDGVCGISRDNGSKNELINAVKKVTTNWFQYRWLDVSGFISTITSFAMSCIFYKAFTNRNDIKEKLSVSLSPGDCFTYKPRVEGDIPQLKDIKNYICLYGGWGEPIAVHFENKMVECGIASVQVCDYRNFCHGRFIFLPNHFEDTAMVLIVTPREKEFVRKLILEGTSFRSGDIFPRSTPIIMIETNKNSPLATIDLIIKESVLFSEIAKAVDVEPCNPNQPSEVSIDKAVPKNVEYDGLLEMGGLSLVGDNEGENNNPHEGMTTGGTIKGISRKKVIKYDPKKSVAQIAKLNDGISEATVRAFIKEQRIDREYDKRMVLFNRIVLEYIKDSTISIAALARKLSPKPKDNEKEIKMSQNTVKQYLNEFKRIWKSNDEKIDIPSFKPRDNKVGMAIVDETIVKIKKEIDRLKKDSSIIDFVFKNGEILVMREGLDKAESADAKDAREAIDKARKLYDSQVKEYSADGLILYNSYKKDGSEILSNFYQVDILYKGKVYNCVDQLYYYRMFTENCNEDVPLSDEVIEALMKCKSGGEIKHNNLVTSFENKLTRYWNKRIGKKEWSYRQWKLIYESIKLKFDCCQEFRDYLIETQDRMIAEDSFWIDTFWGTVCDGDKYIGVNASGRCLMSIRDEYMGKEYDRLFDKEADSPEKALEGIMTKEAFSKKQGKEE